MSFAVHPEQRSPAEETRVRAGTAPPALARAETASWTWLAPLERAIARRVLAWIGEVPFSIVLPGGEEVRSGSRPPIARIRVADAGTLLGLLGPDAELHFGDAYADGRIDVEGDLRELLVAACSAPADGWMTQAASWWRWIRRRGNTVARARVNAHHHYDLGNDFYRL